MHNHTHSHSHSHSHRHSHGDTKKTGEDNANEKAIGLVSLILCGHPPDLPLYPCELTYTHAHVSSHTHMHIHTCPPRRHRQRAGERVTENTAEGEGELRRAGEKQGEGGGG